MSRAILLLLLMIFLARAVWRFLEGIAAGAMSTGTPPRRSPTAPPAVKLVQDPVCGTFVVPDRSIHLVHAGHTVYFCSEACRLRYGH